MDLQATDTTPEGDEPSTTTDAPSNGAPEDAEASTTRRRSRGRGGRRRRQSDGDHDGEIDVALDADDSQQRDVLPSGVGDDARAGDGDPEDATDDGEPDDARPGEASGEDADDERGGTAPRRRRGRRGGRGRRGRSPSRDGDDVDAERATSDGPRAAGRGADDDDDDDDATDDDGRDGEATDGEEREGRTRSGGRSRGRRRRGRGGTAATDRDRGPDDDDERAADGRGSDDDDDGIDDDDDDDEDDERDGEDRRLEDEISRSGTRRAARRGTKRDGGGRSDRRRERPGGVSEEVRRALLEGPPRTMLVTAGSDRTQIAILEDRTLVEHYVTRAEDVTFVGNIYMGRVQNVLPGMEAAFIDIGKGRNGVLYAGEVLYDELDLEESEASRIEDVLKPGQKVLVQVTKDPMGSKGPRLTMRLSLAGRYLVLAPNSDLFGISRKLTDRERDRLRRIVKGVKPAEHGIIVRTAAEGVSEEHIVADVERLLAKWAKVETAAAGAKALATVYEEPPLVVKVIRDNFGPGFERCVVDDEALHAQVRDYLDEVAPELLDLVELRPTPAPDERGRPGATLFELHDVHEQLRKAMGRKVWLPSGGYLIIESTEAMKVIDVNTGKFTGGADANLEEVVLKTNLEAAEEIVRQLRLRDMGGMIIIDFIDMLLKSNQDQVVRRLKRELLRDRTKTRVSEVSRLGLVQMTRKNVSQGLIESFSHTCSACEGRGFINELG
jgi:Rne/Rng family ribonuclease